MGGDAPPSNSKVRKTKERWLLYNSCAILCVISVFVYSSVALFLQITSDVHDSTGGKAQHKKVALMFLTRGDMPLEPVWKEFFESASIIEPIYNPISPPQPLQQPMREYYKAAQLKHQASLLSTGGTQRGRRLHQGPTEVDFVEHSSKDASSLMEAAEHMEEEEEEEEDDSPLQMSAETSALSVINEDGPIARQSLFSVYVHTAPEYAYNSSSIFSGYQIDNRVHVLWGQYSVAEAERRLLRAAMEDPTNQRFILLSETCTPLYPPHVIWAQALSEGRSRVKACAVNRGRLERWTSRMAGDGILSPNVWRKSSQWKMLIREHAALVSQDTTVWPIFAENCFSRVPGEIRLPKWLDNSTHPPVSTCVSDEHYIPTLLALHKQAKSTTCLDSMTHTDWTPGVWSPKIHQGNAISKYLLMRLRRSQNGNLRCDVSGAMASADTLFKLKTGKTNLAGGSIASSPRWRWRRRRRRRGGESYTYAQPLDQDCRLFARKFKRDAVEALVRLGRVCNGEHGTAMAIECFNTKANLLEY